MKAPELIRVEGLQEMPLDRGWGWNIFVSVRFELETNTTVLAGVLTSERL
jgi:hypothetical protein